MSFKDFSLADFIGTWHADGFDVEFNDDLTGTAIFARATHRLSDTSKVVYVGDAGIPRRMCENYPVMTRIILGACAVSATKAAM